jgi:hypothetical protein
MTRLRQRCAAIAACVALLGATTAAQDIDLRPAPAPSAQPVPTPTVGSPTPMRVRSLAPLKVEAVQGEPLKVERIRAITPDAAVTCPSQCVTPKGTRLAVAVQDENAPKAKTTLRAVTVNGAPVQIVEGECCEGGQVKVYELRVDGAGQGGGTFTLVTAGDAVARAEACCDDDESCCEDEEGEDCCTCKDRAACNAGECDKDCAHSCSAKHAAKEKSSKKSPAIGFAPMGGVKVVDGGVTIVQDEGGKKAAKKAAGDTKTKSVEVYTTDGKTRVKVDGKEVPAEKFEKGGMRVFTGHEAPFGEWHVTSRGEGSFEPAIRRYFAEDGEWKQDIERAHDDLRRAHDEILRALEEVRRDVMENSRERAIKALDELKQNLEKGREGRTGFGHRVILKDRSENKVHEDDCDDEGRGDRAEVKRKGGLFKWLGGDFGHSFGAEAKPAQPQAPRAAPAAPSAPKAPKAPAAPQAPTAPRFGVRAAPATPGTPSQGVRDEVERLREEVRELREALRNLRREGSKGEDRKPEKL